MIFSFGYNVLNILLVYQVPEFETSFFVELYEVGAGAALNDSARFAYIIVPESDSPRGLIYFAVGSRLSVAHKKTTLISLQVVRDSSTVLAISVAYSTQVGLIQKCEYCYVSF